MTRNFVFLYVFLSFGSVLQADIVSTWFSDFISKSSESSVEFQVRSDSGLSVNALNAKTYIRGFKKDRLERGSWVARYSDYTLTSQFKPFPGSFDLESITVEGSAKKIIIKAKVVERSITPQTRNNYEVSDQNIPYRLNIRIIGPDFPIFWDVEVE